MRCEDGHTQALSGTRNGNAPLLGGQHTAISYASVAVSAEQSATHRTRLCHHACGYCNRRRLCHHPCEPPCRPCAALGSRRLQETSGAPAAPPDNKAAPLVPISEGKHVPPVLVVIRLLAVRCVDWGGEPLANAVWLSIAIRHIARWARLHR